MKPREILGELSYADGVRIMNQYWLDSGSDEKGNAPTLRQRVATTRIDMSNLFG
jgi:hypothetical protein